MKSKVFRLSATIADYWKPYFFIGSNIKEESRSTGELVLALGVSSAMIDKDGSFNVRIGFPSHALMVKVTR